MITLAVAWYARSREEFESEIFAITGLLDVMSLVVIGSIITELF
jgi:hypothetical protein